MKKISKLFVMLLVTAALALSVVGCNSTTIVEMNVQNFNTVYEVGESLDVSGSYLDVTYSNGTSDQVTVTNNLVKGFSSATAGEINVTIEYKSMSVKVKVYIISDAITPTEIDSEDFVDTFADIMVAVSKFTGRNLTLQEAKDLISEGGAEAESDITLVRNILEDAGFTLEDVEAVIDLMESFVTTVEGLKTAMNNIAGNDLVTTQMVTDVFNLYDNVKSTLTPYKIATLLNAFADNAEDIINMIDPEAEDFEVMPTMAMSMKQTVALIDDCYKIMNVFRSQSAAKVAETINYVAKITIMKDFETIDLAKVASSMNFAGDLLLGIANVNLSKGTMDYLTAVFDEMMDMMDEEGMGMVMMMPSELLSSWANNARLTANIMRSVTAESLENIMVAVSEVMLAETEEAEDAAMRKVAILGVKIVQQGISKMTTSQMLSIVADLQSSVDSMIGEEGLFSVQGIFDDIKAIAAMNPNSLTKAEKDKIDSYISIFLDAVEGSEPIISEGEQVA